MPCSTAQPCCCSGPSSLLLSRGSGLGKVLSRQKWPVSGRVEHVLVGRSLSGIRCPIKGQQLANNSSLCWGTSGCRPLQLVGTTHEGAGSTACSKLGLRNGAGAGVVCVARSRLAGRSRHACWATSHGAEAKSPISPSIGQPVVVDKWIMISDTKRREPSRGHGRHFWGVFGDSSRPPVRSIGTRYFFLPCADWGWLGVGRSSQLARIELERLALALGRHPLHFQERQDGEGGEGRGPDGENGKMGKWGRSKASDALHAFHRFHAVAI